MSTEVALYNINESLKTISKTLITMEQKLDKAIEYYETITGKYIEGTLEEALKSGKLKLLKREV